MPYVDTKKLTDYVNKCLPALNKSEYLDYIYSQSGATTSKARYLLKFGSGKMVNFGIATTTNLKVMLTNLETRTKNEPPSGLFYGLMTEFPANAEIYREYDARRDQKKNKLLAEQNAVKNAVDTLQTVSEPSGEIQTAILAELRAIRELQEETCRFIKTLVFALNGTDEKHRIE